MLVNADFSQRAAVTPQQYEWVPSPQPGVERVMLDRVGAEKARATSIVRYAPDSSFPPHAHPGGEEILVLDGVFSDESGDFPAGWYLRNPPGSSHRPASRAGALIFVKLWQMAPDDRRRVQIDTRDPAAWTHTGGHSVCALFSSADEQVSLHRLEAGQLILEQADGGAELFVLAGEIVADELRYVKGSWIRLPPGDWPDWKAGASGVTFYLKTGHLSCWVGGSSAHAVIATP